MAQPQQQPRQQRSAWRTALYWVAGALAVLILFTAILAAIGADFGRTPAQQIDAAINEDPRAAAALRVIETSFPADYAAMRTALIAAIAPGAPPNALRVAMHGEMRDFLRAHRADMARAPAAELAMFRTAQLTALETMQRESTERCAQAATGAVDITTPPSPAAANAMVALVTAQVRSAAAGARTPSLRAPAPRDADSLALFAAMRRLGASNADIERLVGTSGLNGASTTDQCRIAIIFARALLVIPTQAADRISAAVIAAS